MARLLLGTTLLAQALTLATSAVPAFTTIGNQGVDRFGHDLGQPSQIATPADCANACAGNPSCVAWAMGLAGDGCREEDVGMCWLKDALAPQKINACRISGTNSTGTMVNPTFQRLELKQIMPAGTWKGVYLEKG